MKRFIIAILVVTAFIFANGKDFNVDYQRSSNNQMELNFNVGDFNIIEVEENGVFYSKINYPGVVTNQKGYAELPKINANLRIGNENDVMITAVDGEYTEIQLEHPLLPSRGTIYRNQDPETIPYLIDPESVIDAWYPENVAENEEPFIFRDVRGVNIYAYPFQYNSAKLTLRIYKNLTVSVEEDLERSTNLLTIKPDYVDPTMNSVYKSLFINYDELKFTNQLGEFGEMLVIYTSRDASVIQPYIDWKREKGFTVNTTQVSTGTNVKTTIQNAYNSNPNILYVQLVGDWADIKSNTCSVTTSADPMDPDLGNVAGSDLYPELMIGRFSAATTTDVTVQVDKVINYEKYPDISGTWYSTGLGIGSPDGSGIGDDGEIDYEHSDIIKDYKLLPYTYDTVYEAYGSPTSTTVANYVNAGLGVINYTGHGDVTYWVTSSYSTSNINSSTNGSKLPFIFSVACINGAFHNASVCFGEAWLRKSNGGAIATIMATINQPWVPPMRGQDYMNDILTGGYNYSTNPGSGTSTTAADLRTTFGSIAMNGNVLMLAEDYSGSDTQNTINTWTTFGDASVQIRTDTPKTLSVSNTSVEEGTAYTTNIKANSVSFENALVSLYQNGNTFSGFTDLSGNVTINNSLVAGAAKLVVTGYNTETEYLDITVGGGSTPPSTPALVSPTNGGNTTDQTPTFDWADASGATSYTIQVDNNSGFTSLEINQNPSVSNYTPGSNLALGTYYWRVQATNSYGSSSYTSSWTITIEEEMVATLPFYENFDASTNLPSGWQIIDNQGNGQVWQFGTHTDGLTGSTGNYAYLNSDAYGSGNSQNTDLVTPLIDMTGATNVNLSFNHYFRYYDPSTVTLSYSINGGSTWTQIQSWTSTDTANPLAFDQIIAAVAGQSEVKFKWNYTGTWGYYWDVDDIAITAQDPIDPPTATTQTASSILLNTATLNGSVNANGESTTVTFEYGLTTGYGSTVSAVPSTVTGSTNTAVYANISGLTESTTYNYRVKAISAGGTTYGTNQVFTTDDPAPAVNPPTNLISQVNQSDVALSWTAPESMVEPDTMNDGFESYLDFALTFLPWTQIDGDGSATYGSTDGDFPNENYTGSYIVFNPSQATPALTGSWDARTGSKYAACFAAQTPANDDWLISPALLVGSGYDLNFYARSLNDTYGLERFKVGVSTTGTSAGDFTIISSGSYVEVPTAWTNYNYDLSTYSGQTVYLAIICVSNDAFVFMVDDITVDNSKGEAILSQTFETTTLERSEKEYTKSKYTGKNSPVAELITLEAESRNAKSTLTGYKVYRNGSSIATINDPFDLTYDDTGLSNGSYSYYVTALYSDPTEESAPTNTENVNISTQFVIDSYPWSESFEVSVAPDEWVSQNASANTWVSTTGYTIGETTILAQDGAEFAYVQWHATDSQDEWLITPLLDFSSIDFPELKFWFNGSYYYSVDPLPNAMLKVMQRVDGGSWSEIWRASDHVSFDADYVNYSWLETTLSIDGYSKGLVQFAFVYQGTDGANFGVDNVSVDGDSSGPRDFMVISPDGLEVHLSWQPVTGATFYHIYRSADPYALFTEIGTTTEVTYVDDTIGGSKMFFYYLTADNAKK